ncbi:MAG: CCA tRNA nucleotidyltransferase [Chloroflexota bacterium]
MSSLPAIGSLNLPPLLGRVAAVLPDGIAAYAVGGMVRDVLLGRPSCDWDLAVSGGALRMARRVADRLEGAYFPMDVEHDTARVILHLEGGRRIHLDFAGLRGGGLDSDLQARDFTVNAMAVDIRQPEALLDPLGGLADLRAKRLRACSATAMRDDPVRVLRGVRQAAALGFQIVSETRAQMRAAVCGLPGISPERQRDELFKILGGPQPTPCLRALEFLGALPYLLPELLLLKGVEQSLPHRADVWNHTLDVVSALGEILAALSPHYDPDRANNLTLGLLVLRLGRFRASLHEHFAVSLNTDRTLRPLLFLAALYHDIAKPLVRTQDADGRIRFLEHELLGADTVACRARAFHLSNAETERLKQIVRGHMRPLLLAQEGLPTPRAVYRFFRDTGEAGVEICLLSLADMLGTYGPALPQERWAALLDVIRVLLEAWWERPQEAISPPALLNGHDLMQALKLSPGPQVGELLEAIREAQAMGTVTTREEAFALAREAAAKTGR